MLEIIRCNEATEFLSYFEEYKELHNLVNYKYQALKNHITILSDYWFLKKEREELCRKEVGLFFKDYCFSGMMFPLLFDGKSLEDLLRQMSINKLESWVNKYE